MKSLGLCLLAALLSMATGSQADSGPVFEPPVVYGLSGEAKTVAVGDLNGDGRDDVAVTAWPAGLHVLYQQPDGSLGPPVQLCSPNMPLGLAIGDLNHDSRMDLAVGGSSGTILLFYQLNDGTLGWPDSCFGYGLVNSLVIDDLNGDGLADIADTSATYPALLVSLQAAGGTFGLPISYPLTGSNARSLCALDFNSDGIRDLACLVDNRVCNMAGLPYGGFAGPLYTPAPWAYALAAGDVNGDGRDDLVFTVPDSIGYGAIGVIPQPPDKQPASAQFYPAYAYAQALALTDLNGDGRNDVVAVHSGYDAVSALCQNADGTLGDWTTYPVPYGSNYECGALATGDLNSDGSPDLALADMWNGLVVLLHTPNTAAPLPDVTAPVCTASLSGTLGLDGWYTSAVTLSLTAEDEAGGSGLSQILTTRDDTTWAAYSEPLVISEQGVTTIGYLAEDNAGNRSQARQVSVKVDTAPPVLSLQPQIDTIWPPTGSPVDVSVSVAASDAASGIARLHLAVKDEYGLVQPELDVVPGSTVNVPLVASRDNNDADGRIYTIVLTATDQAGNRAAVSSIVTVPRNGSSKPKKK